jgi:hypothetical protein
MHPMVCAACAKVLQVQMYCMQHAPRCDVGHHQSRELVQAFIKARGDGLGFQPLSRAEFRFPEGDGAFTSADLYLDGQLQTR